MPNESRLMPFALAACLAAGLGACLGGSVAWACQCSVAHIGESPIEARNRSMVVFQGIYVDDTPVDEVPGLRRFTFAVQRAWKGVESERVEVYAEQSAVACGFDPPLQKGIPYVVYAIPNLGVYEPAWIEPVSGQCTRTRPYVRGGEDEVALGAATFVGLAEENWSTIKTRF